MKHSKSNIIYFPIGKDQEVIRAKKVAYNRNPDLKQVIVLAMNTPKSGEFAWGQLLMLIEINPEKPLVFVTVVDRVPEGKPWRILKR
jgi:hypothetical protein